MSNRFNWRPRSRKSSPTHGTDALLLVLDGVTDPHNLGACLRVADAMGVHAVVAPKDRAVGLTPTVSKVASGAAETVPYIAVTNLARTIRELKEQGLRWSAPTRPAQNLCRPSSPGRSPGCWAPKGRECGG